MPAFACSSSCILMHEIFRQGVVTASVAAQDLCKGIPMWDMGLVWSLIACLCVLDVCHPFRFHSIAICIHRWMCFWRCGSDWRSVLRGLRTFRITSSGEYLTRMVRVDDASMHRLSCCIYAYSCVSRVHIMADRWQARLRVEGGPDGTRGPHKWFQQCNISLGRIRMLFSGPVVLYKM